MKHQKNLVSVVMPTINGDKTIVEVTGQVQKIPLNGGKIFAISLSQGETVIVQAADLEFDCSALPSIIEPILSNRADAVYGSRFIVEKATRVLCLYHYLANKCLTFFSNFLTDLNLTNYEVPIIYYGRTYKQGKKVGTKIGLAALW